MMKPLIFVHQTNWQLELRSWGECLYVYSEHASIGYLWSGKWAPFFGLYFFRVSQAYGISLQICLIIWLKINFIRSTLNFA